MCCFPISITTTNIQRQLVESMTQDLHCEGWLVMVPLCWWVLLLPLLLHAAKPSWVESHLFSALISPAILLWWWLRVKLLAQFQWRVQQVTALTVYDASPLDSHIQVFTNVEPGEGTRYSLVRQVWNLGHNCGFLEMLSLFANYNSLNGFTVRNSTSFVLSCCS